MKQTNERLCALAQKGDAAALDSLIENNKSFIGKVANDLFRSMNLAQSGLNLDTDDLKQAGNLGLWKAVPKFDAARGMKFLTYAAPAIRNAMMDMVRDAFSAFEQRMQTEDKEEERNLPSLRTSLIAPVVTIVLLALRPAAGINIDPLIALPVGGLCGAICMKQWKNILPSIAYGLQKMSVVAILLIGTGTIAGIIKNSSLKDWILTGLDHAHISDALIAPISGALMSAATASTTAGATLASSSFAETILAIGISAVWGAAMINSGATVLDHLPHGSFFHATGGVCELNFKERLKLIPYESLIGIVLAAGTTILYIISN